MFSNGLFMSKRKEFPSEKVAQNISNSFSYLIILKNQRASKSSPIGKNDLLLADKIKTETDKDREADR
jgi:hypothetical protein